MKHQKGAYQTDRKTGNDLSQRMMSQNDTGRTQHTGYQYKQAQPPYRVITEQGAKGNQSAYHSAYARHVLAQFPSQIYCYTNNGDYERSQNNAGHVPRQIQPTHHQQAEYIRNDSQQDRYKTFLPFAQLLTSKTIDLAEQKDGYSGSQYSKAIDNSQYNQLIYHRHDTEIRKQE